MKHITLILIPLLFACSKKQTETIIYGKINGKIPAKIECTLPIDGICSYLFAEPIEADSLGNFIIKRDIDKATFQGILANDYHLLIIEPGKTYHVNIDINSEEEICTVDNNAQAFYDSLPNLNPRLFTFSFNDELTNYKIINERISSDLNNEIKELSKLFESNEISEQVYNLIKLDRQVYYSTVTAALASRVNIRLFSSKNKKTPQDVFDIWGKAVTEISFSNPILIQTSHLYEYFYDYLWYNIYTNYELSEFRQMRKDFREKGLIHTNTVSLVKEFFPEEYQEFFIGAYINVTSRQKKFEKELIALFQEFKTDFPESRYPSYINPRIEEIVAFHEKVESDFDGEMKFVDDYKNKNTLAECLKPFKGKKVYVDIWATTCGYCKDEFAHNKKLKDLLSSKNVEMLYISTDRDKEEQRWKDMIKYYELSGYHVRANKELISEIRNLPDYSGIPRYLLIDENGRIVNNDSKRPSEIKELEKQLDKI